MKRNLFFAALAVVAMASCAKNEAVDPSASTESEAISFETFIDRTTKASVTTAESLQESGFKVIAYNSYTSATDNVPFENVAVTYSSGAWSYTDTQYWENDDNITFYAYASTTAATAALNSSYDASSNTDQTATLDIVTDDTIADQEDVVVASPVNASYDSDVSTSATPINLNFNHILSKIGFTAQAGEVEDTGVVSTAEVTLKKVEVSVANPGSATGLISKATYNMVSGAWKFAATTASETYLEITTPEEISGDILGTAGVALTDTPTNVTNSDGYLMIIPQELKSDEVITVTATYDQGASSDVTKTVTVPTSLISEFEQGKQYTLNLLIGDTAIRFSTVTVSDFTDGSYTM